MVASPPMMMLHAGLRPEGYQVKNKGAHIKNRGTRMRLVKLVAAATVIIASAMGSAMAKDWKEIRIGTEGAYPPFNSVAADGSLVGFDIDIGNALCEKMQAKCTWVAQDWDGIIPALLAGKYDMIVASMSITEERKQKVAFTNKYYQTPPSFVAPKDTKITDWSPEGLKGTVVGAQSSTIHANFLEEVYKPAGVEVKLYPTAVEAQADLAAGRLDAYLDDIIVGSNWVASADGACCANKFSVDAVKYAAILGNGAGISMRKEDTELLEKVNKALAEIIADGTYKKINDKYFPFSIY
ncbi:MAG: ABC transporter substrate-binding protein [Pseudomonadota bacterium]